MDESDLKIRMDGETGNSALTSQKPRMSCQQLASNSINGNASEARLDVDGRGVCRETDLNPGLLTFFDIF